eukprot:9906806-Alexandrium_andersonii.AAC.1
MSASLVGSEMCIRDRPRCPPPQCGLRERGAAPARRDRRRRWIGARACPCLLYTSDAADDM